MTTLRLSTLMFGLLLLAFSLNELSPPVVFTSDVKDISIDDMRAGTFTVGGEYSAWVTSIVQFEVHT